MTWTSLGYRRAAGRDNPDLIVEFPSVDDNTLTTGQSFTEILVE